MSQLITELLEGIRLPEPESCPSAIAQLIVECFEENASNRPSFKNIKEVIEKDYANLRRATRSDDIKFNEKEELQYADLEFEHKYLEMRIQNQNQRELKSGILKIDQEIALDETSLTASFKNEPSRYLSLHDVTSSTNPLQTVKDGSHDSIKRKESTENEVLLRNPKYSLSPGSNEYKRFFSYGGEDPAPALQPEKLKSNPLMPAKSYPNPTYLIFPSILNSNHTEVDSILNKYYEISNIE